MQNNYSLLILKITDVGEIEAKDINLKLRIEVNKTLSKEAKASDYQKLGEIKPNESKEITFGFIPLIAGKISVRIISSYKSVSGKYFSEKMDEIFCTIRQKSDGIFLAHKSEIIIDSKTVDLEKYGEQVKAIYSKREKYQRY